MIVVRDIFRLKFGHAKEATELWKKGVPMLEKNTFGRPLRLLTDFVGPAYYTIILESTFESLTQWEQARLANRQNPDWRALYQQILTMTDEGRREILSVVE